MPHAAPERHVRLVEPVSDRSGASARRHRSAPRNPEGVHVLRNAMPAAVEAAGIAPRLGDAVAPRLDAAVAATSAVPA
ncbi:hypothetical protein [Agromyces sp. SYSU T00266]|uniref:hypothetical protein n=1 Tax=Agromyces zhanjiangensis TaxID=3158562 RepID=UPI003392564C